MLFRAPTVLVAAFFAGLVLAERCQPGEYRDNSGKCHDCADGYISSNASPNGQPAYSCEPCPAGQSSNPAHTQCQKCEPGTANGVEGGTCEKCEPGYFNNVSGAKSCCQCCSGFYSNNPRTHCNKCAESKPYSFPGSNKNDDCVKPKDRTTEPEPVDSCDMVADNVCPNPTGGGPVGTAITRKKRTIYCTKGFDSCPHYSGRGGFECVDTQNDPESCGGCVSLDVKGKGTDCTAIDGVSVSRCVKGSCVIDSCGKGYAKSLDGSSCISAFNSQQAIRGRAF
ncbi:hypothetical protein M407DRAFT_21121 [Tulasnella calospora MUT 4182]|uniref:Protein CPL1-like domain-containing protein n=1 Tax=Tulasnella calospora MUT 4182 TaxID=1051891 RepID=A0A0C3QEN9_9AGAM|nr:hypothetical protein M407DRAFT_21121 [Tulasnella calospora MUT 4182]